MNWRLTGELRELATHYAKLHYDIKELSKLESFGLQFQHHKYCLV